MRRSSTQCGPRRCGGIGRSSDPNIAYVEGKYLFFHSRYDEAVARLGTIPKGNKNWFQAQYITGASRVAQARPGEAAQIFDALAKVDPGKGLTAGLAVACLAVIANRLVGGLAEKRLAAQRPRN